MVNLQPAEGSGCVVTISRPPHDPCTKAGGNMQKVDYGSERKPVTLHPNVSKNECDGQWSCSGVILDASLGIVLCHGAIFFPFLKKTERKFPETDDNLFLANDFVTDLIIQVECPSEPRNAKLEDHPITVVQEQRIGLIPIANHAGSPSDRQQLCAQILMLVPCVEFHVAFSRLFGKTEGWVFSSEEEKHEFGEMQKDLAYLHWFAVLRLQCPLTVQCGKITFIDSSKLLKGSEVFACGSPFGSFYPDIFLNTVSKGVLSNTAGHRNVVLLTDARCLPGSEGGGIFVVEGDWLHLAGIVVSPLCWKNNEWVGLTLACSISHILRNITKALGRTSAYVKHSLEAMQLVNNCVADLKRSPNHIEQLVAAVVLIDSGGVWGSGVLLDQKMVLTCRHVVRDATNVLVKIRHPASDKFQTVTGQVLFCTEEASPFDIAVVELEKMVPGIPKPVWPSDYRTGEDVFVLAYGAFGENCGPSVTSGSLSAVICVGDVPAMLQTTCAVHGGSSGGPVVSARSGKLLGIVTSNTRDNATGATYPHLNFSIPISVLQTALQRYRQFGELSGFQELNKASRAVRDVWRLQRRQENVLQSKL
ncbi:peroxisomal leader peptide-processing protease [Bombina bombina]|uniref:peroxisomal leader peptide-processing protease n=1 Tax=Bombina bombina TaxID=8345 RepID=UPI00235AEECF|nr:peroxisomal leader peptide-processing protease [Bombina bombina]